MTTKIHPHLKSFIHSVVMSEMTTLVEGPDGKLGPSKSYLWKEDLTQQILKAVQGSLETISTQQDLENVIDDEIINVKAEFERTLDMAGRTLKQIPLEHLRATVRR